MSRPDAPSRRRPCVQSMVALAVAALIGFYTAATLTAAGLALLVLAIAMCGLIGARDPD